MSNKNNTSQLNDILFKFCDAIQDADERAASGEIRNSRYAMLKTEAHLDAKQELEAYIQSQLQEQLKELLKHSKSYTVENKVYGTNQIVKTESAIPVKAVEELQKRFIG
jgi:hypothetical protein